jgi:hypothetical protein
MKETNFVLRNVQDSEEENSWEYWQAGAHINLTLSPAG